MGVSGKRTGKFGIRLARSRQDTNGATGYEGDEGESVVNSVADSMMQAMDKYVEEKEEEETVSLYDRLDAKLFKAELSDKRYSDIIRTAHIITVETRRGREPPETFSTKETVTDEEYPDRHKREMTRMILVIEKLIQYFKPGLKKEATVASRASEVEGEMEPGDQGEDEEDRGEREREEEKEDDMERIIDFMYNYSDKYSQQLIPKRHFNLGKMFSLVQEEFKTSEHSLCLLKVKSVLKFLHLSVIIQAIEELRAKLELGLDYLTKDMKDGWQIKIKLNERFLEISHVRQESVLKQKGEHNYWEIGYNITMCFDSTMRKFSAVRLSLTDLKMGDDIDEDLAQELKHKFFEGNFIVC